MCLFAAMLWLAADELSGHAYSSPLIPYWNAFVRLGYFASVAYLASRLREEQATQSKLARADSLTCLPNRRAFLEVADRESRRSRRLKLPLTLAYVDLDNFKMVNDKYGHNIGDELLRVVGHALRSGVRVSDTVARIGGDEFAILLPDTNQSGAEVLLEGLRGSLLKAMRAKDWPVTFSIGSITFPGGASIEEMIRRADALMYEVKKGGKGSINFDLTSGDSFRQGTQTV